jgi:hypothetical protein
MSSASTAEIRITENKDALARLRRLGHLRKDEKGREFYVAMYDGKSVPFYLGHVRTIPAEWAKGIVASYIMPMDEECVNCHDGKKSKGYTVAGLCQVCKGTKLVSTNIERPLFKLLSERDPLLEDMNLYQAPPDVEITKKKEKVADAAQS